MSTHVQPNIPYEYVGETKDLFTRIYSGFSFICFAQIEILYYIVKLFYQLGL